jgi:hypothetical protein
VTSCWRPCRASWRSSAILYDMSRSSPGTTGGTREGPPVPVTSRSDRASSPQLVSLRSRMRAGGRLTCPAYAVDLVRLPVSIMHPVRLARHTKPTDSGARLLGMTRRLCLSRGRRSRLSKLRHGWCGSGDSGQHDGHIGQWVHDITFLPLLTAARNRLRPRSLGSAVRFFYSVREFDLLTITVAAVRYLATIVSTMNRLMKATSEPAKGGITWSLSSHCR